MVNEEIYGALKNNLVFQGIAVRDFEKGLFCGLFDIKGVSFMIDNVKYDNDEGQSWNVDNSIVYHYTIPSDEEDSKVCPFCDYQYEIGKPISNELMCEYLNEKVLLAGIWGNCVFAETFEKTFSELSFQLNPAGIKRSK